MGLKTLVAYHEWRDTRLADGFGEASDMNRRQTEKLAEFKSLGRSTFTEFESKQLISAWGVSTTQESIATTADEAAQMAAGIGFPVAIKIDSPDILHKTEAGGLKLGINNEEEARAAFTEVLDNAKQYNPNAKINGTLVQEMVSGGTEFIVGVSYDSQLGPILLFGTGGVMVEVYNDVALRQCPITPSEARGMIKQVRGSRLLEGFRGAPKGDIDALVSTLVNISNLAVHLDGNLSELDINPLMVLSEGNGVKAADALVAF